MFSPRADEYAAAAVIRPSRTLAASASPGTANTDPANATTARADTTVLDRVSLDTVAANSRRRTTVIAGLHHWEAGAATSTRSTAHRNPIDADRVRPAPMSNSFTDASGGCG